MSYDRLIREASRIFMPSFAGFPGPCETPPFELCPSCVKADTWNTAPAYSMCKKGHCPPCCWTLKIQNIGNAECADCALLDGTLDTMSILGGSANPLYIGTGPWDPGVEKGYGRLCEYPHSDGIGGTFAKCVAAFGQTCTMWPRENRYPYHESSYFLWFPWWTNVAEFWHMPVLEFYFADELVARWVGEEIAPHSFPCSLATEKLELPLQWSTPSTALGGHVCAWADTVAVLSPWTPTVEHPVPFPMGEQCPRGPQWWSCYYGLHPLDFATELPEAVTLTLSELSNDSPTVGYSRFNGPHVLQQVVGANGVCAYWGKSLDSGAFYGQSLWAAISRSCPSDQYDGGQYGMVLGVGLRVDPGSTEGWDQYSGHVITPPVLDRYGRAHIGSLNGVGGELQATYYPSGSFTFAF